MLTRIRTQFILLPAYSDVAFLHYPVIMQLRTSEEVMRVNNTGYNSSGNIQICHFNSRFACCYNLHE